MSGGHYFSYTKHRKNKLWYYFDDEVVRKIKDENKVVSKEAYILFYSKMSVDEFFRQTLSEPGLWPHIIDADKTQTNNFKLSNKPSTNDLCDDLLEELKKESEQLLNSVKNTTANFTG